MRSKKIADDSEVLVGISDVEALTGYERTTIWRKSRAEPPTFPRPNYVGNRRMWRLADVREWLSAEMARSASSRRGAGNLGAIAGAK